MKRFAEITVPGYPVGMVLVALLLGVAPVSSSTIVGIIDWDANTPETAWSADEGDVGVDVTGETNKWLQITFPEGSVPENVLVSGRAADLFAGTWSSDYWIEFDFWAQSTLPDTLQVRWWDSGSTNVWGSAVTPSASGNGSWQTLRTPSLGSAVDWDLGLGDPADFLADLASIDWIGVYIDRVGTGEEIYGVDDFSLMVPEPAEVLMLVAAFGVGLLVWRRMRLVPVGA